MKSKKIKSLKLVKGDKFKIIYDFGDYWEFLITVSKEEKTEDKDIAKFKVIDGKGLGIVEDCGGIWGLAEIIYKEFEDDERKEYYENIDIDYFNIQDYK